MICPYCGGSVPGDTTVCPDCQEDLAGLARLEYGHAIYYNEALALAREGRLEEACAKLVLALEFRDSFVPAHVLLAKVYARQGRWAEAQASAARALELSPKGSNVGELVGALERASREAEGGQLDSEQAVSRARRGEAERYFATHQRDIAGAFGVGMGVAAFLGLLVSWIGGRRRSRN